MEERVIDDRVILEVIYQPVRNLVCDSPFKFSIV